MTFLKKFKKSSKHKIIIIVGPTASGKSALAVKWAKKINGEIISADSRQVYKGLDLASGKITKKEMMGIKHHCLDLVSPKTVFTAQRFKKCAQNAIKNIQKRGKIPIIVGGTGFYIDAALGRIEIPKIPPDWRLRKKLEKKTPRELFLWLKKLDPSRAKTIEPQNKRRLIRALEIAKTTGRVPEVKAGKNEYRPLWLGIKVPPEKLRKNINQRLKKRLKSGMSEEINRLHKSGLGWRRLDELGLEPRWISRYLRGLVSKEEMVAKLQTAIWQYSRRQMTWLKRNQEIQWINTQTK